MKSIKKIFFCKSFLIFLSLGLITRFYNLSNRLYFVWDNGRDAWAIDKIIHGDLTLIGHTSGIQGFFLGPAWFYLGTLGHLLGKGNPWVISYWYLAVTAVAMPLFWLLANKLFKEKFWQYLSAYLLLLTPASIHWSSFVWNPMITIPLMAGTYLALLKARKSRFYLSLAFFLLALALQFEFAYAIFFIFSLFLLIPFIRQKINIRDFIYVSLAIGITLVPQILFELRHKFMMTQSLLNAMFNKTTSVSWQTLWQTRPQALFEVTQNQLFGDSLLAKISMLLVLVTLGIGAYLLFIKKILSRAKPREKTKNLYKLQISLILTFIPYIFFLLWRGNEGRFFDYYLTPHFVFLIPASLLSFEYLIKNKLLVFKKINLGILFLIFFLLTSSMAIFKEIKNEIIFVENQAGLKIMTTAIKQLYDWQNQDATTQGTFRIFTPNRETQHYDYLVFWEAKKNQLAIPFSTFTGKEAYWYILIEPDRELPPAYRFDPWYKEATQSGELVREKQIGVLKLETWKKIK